MKQNSVYPKEMPEHVEIYQDPTLKTVFLAQPLILKTFKSQLDAFYYCANIFNEQTPYTFFEYNGDDHSNQQAIYFDSTGSQKLIEQEKIFQGFPLGSFFLKVNFKYVDLKGDDEKYKFLNDAMKIVQFTKGILENTNYDDLYDEVSQWIETNIK